MFKRRERFISNSLLTRVFFFVNESQKISPVHTKNEENYDFPKTISAMRSAEVAK